MAFLADFLSVVFVFADDFTTLEVEVVDDDVVPFSDLKPHPIRAPEKATDNKTSEQTWITILFIFINLFSVCILYYKIQALFVIDTVNNYV
ncbi:hypothetical protein CV713_10050 [Streptococcus thermophilus]|uniref:hypothetical protein n=1 Tax=Streptococcus thermophilus TaxID=1308 RepID=UPI000C2286B1|nr:hypothetical protein [Streptococcus thermophilus]MBW7803101.1 hypothetical protein [Streptococcus thermophilus]MDA3674249.1 hypothetical protein [Streptococcus thermophilus]MDA5413922.1 hypothetical protein [Streptococcus thermophilus]PJH80322.1 hypothetical protein CV714_08800 [Streptococcus thermophilus]PJH81914.1 hypothetical protein CV713_10050 [Streptococcus thermophilus]